MANLDEGSFGFHAALKEVAAEELVQLIDNTGDVTIVTMVRPWFDYGPWIQMSKESLNLMELAVTWEVANELRFTMLGSCDPVDRFLVATAKVYDLTLVTADERLMRIPGIHVLANR